MSLPAHAPTPTLPTGAGGPLRRAAGRACQRPEALVLEPDALLRLQVCEAVRALGLQAQEATAHEACAWGRGPAAPAAVFVGLDGGACCAPVDPAAVLATGRAAPRPLRVGYAARHPALLAAHRLHRCCDVVLELRVEAGRPRFAHPAPASAVERAALSAREADVLLLLCAGLSTPAVAARLCVSPATARSHCRSVLRKLGARDRRELRTMLLGGGRGPGAGGGEFAPGPC